MTDREIRETRAELTQWIDGKPPVFSEKQKRLYDELDCRSMINSIFIYHGATNIIHSPYMTNFVVTLGSKTVRRLINEQIHDLKTKAKSAYGVYNDPCGGVYHGVAWEDERNEN